MDTLTATNMMDANMVGFWYAMGFFTLAFVGGTIIHIIHRLFGG